MEEKTRKTGIDVIGDVFRGAHICQFYQTKQDLIDILVPYFKAGLGNNEFCMWVTSGHLNEKEAEEAMSKAVTDFAQYLEKGQIEVIPYDQWYLKDGAFNRQRVASAWIDKLEQALGKGYDGIRVTGDRAWIEKKDWGKFADYEEKANSAFGKYRMLAICTYHLGRCGAGEVIDVVRNHQFALIRRGGEWVNVNMEGSGYKWTEEALRESEKKYRSLFENMLDGFAYCQILVDENNKPIDFVYLEVNDAFERLTGLRKEDVVGEKVTEAIPGIKEAHPELFSIYGKVALTGERTKFDIYFEPLEIWLSISVYSPQKGYFVAVFENITELKRAEESQEITSQDKKRGNTMLLQGKSNNSGLDNLSDREAIVLLLGLCLPPQECRKLAKECVKQFKNLRGLLAASPQELEQAGVPPQCISYIKLVHEIPAKVLKEEIIDKVVYQSPQDVFDYLSYSMRDLKNEVFKVIYLNNRNQIIDATDLFEGVVDSIPIRPREIVESAINHNATGLIFAHNHPAGDPAPSKSDKQLTRDLVFMGMVLQIRVLDHLIIGVNTHFSFADAGLIKKYEDSFLNLRIRSMFDSGEDYSVDIPLVSIWRSHR